MKHFKRSEFRGWQMSPELLAKLDVLRNLWGAPIIISPAEGALGRHTGQSYSQHNVDRWQEVRAVDVFADDAGHRTELSFARTFIDVARVCLFTGIGLYPTWTYNGNRRTGFHLDCRQDVHDVAAWSRINGVYKSLEEGLRYYD